MKMQWLGMVKSQRIGVGVGWPFYVYKDEGRCTGMWLIQRNKIGRTCHEYS